MNYFTHYVSIDGIDHHSRDEKSYSIPLFFFQINPTMTDLDSTEILDADESLTESSSTNDAVGRLTIDLKNDR